MANPNIPGIPRTEQDLLYQKLSVYNSGRTSYKEVGAYLVALPRYEHPAYSLWIYSPLPEHQSIFYICDLSEDVHDSLRIASTLCFYSQRPLYVVEYNAKRMQSKGDDLVFSENIGDTFCTRYYASTRLTCRGLLSSSNHASPSRNALYR